MGECKQIQEVPTLATHKVRALHADGRLVVATAEEVPAEHMLNVYIGDRLAMRLICTATSLRELVAGRLHSEGLIEDGSHLVSIELNEAQTEARVTLGPGARPLRARAAEFVPSATTGSRVFAEVVQTPAAEGRVVPIPWSPDDIFSLARVFADDSPMHRSTMGVHSCYLARGAEVLCRCEDLGRHNAFDKVIGYALLNQIDVRACTVFSSGRLPVDMISKAVQAGIPIVASKSVTTDHAIKLARRTDLTLICSAWPDSMRVYHDPVGCAQTAFRQQSVCA